MTANKKIVFLTRPIVPPWDEASKNFALYLAKTVTLGGTSLVLLTTRRRIPGLPSSVKQEAIHNHKALTLASKLKLFWYLVKTDAQCIHSLFVFTPISGVVIKLIKWFKKFTVIQTVAAVSDWSVMFPSTFFGDEIVCFSKMTADKLGRRGIRSTVIPPAVPTAIFRPQEKKNVIAFLSELYRQQSFNIVVSLVETLLMELPNYTIVLGFRTTRKPKEEADYVAKLKQRWQGRARAQFRDVIEDMPSFLGQAKLVVFPATTTTEKFDFPLVLLESLSCATPVIVSKIGALQELAKYPGVVAVSSNKTQEFVEAAKKIIKSYKSYSQWARKTAQDNFDIHVVAKQYEKLYQKLIG